MNNFSKAKQILNEFKDNNYLYGEGVLSQVGDIAAKAGKKAVVIRETFPGSDAYVDIIVDSIKKAGVEVAHIENGAMPNAPREDLQRISDVLKTHNPDVLVSFGGGSTIDAVKSAEVLRTLGGKIDDYFGTGTVTAALEKTGKKLAPHIAIQTVASSGAHLTKYSNITDIATGQKKLVVDDAIVPQYPVFDFSVTYKLPASVTMDGALDGIAHAVEVLYGEQGKPGYEKAKEVAETCVSLIIENLPTVIENPENKEARNSLCLATDLGAYSIMIGGTNGAHLTSFSLVDILSHGRACAIMNPYYTVFFSPVVQGSLKMIGNVYKKYGYSDADFDNLSGRELGVAVAEAMFTFEKKIGFPTTLSEVKGFNDSYIEKALTAAKDPQLKMKLQNMPVPLTAEQVDEYMGPILQSAKTGDLSLIKLL